MLTFLLFIKVGLLYGREGAGAASKFLPGATSKGCGSATPVFS
jgi:hypothetical protein